MTPDRRALVDRVEVYAHGIRMTLHLDPSRDRHLSWGEARDLLGAVGYAAMRDGEAAD